MASLGSRVRSAPPTRALARRDGRCVPGRAVMAAWTPAVPRALPGDVGHPASCAYAGAPRRWCTAPSPQRVGARGRSGAAARPSSMRLVPLVRRGATALTTSCGFLVRWQRAAAGRAAVPMWTSSLLDCCRALRRAGGDHGRRGEPRRRRAARRRAPRGHAGRRPGRGSAPAAARCSQDLPTLDRSAAREADAVAAAQRLVRRHPQVESAGARVHQPAALRRAPCSAPPAGPCTI
ncbi:MAG: hypothetical protein MZW92_58115 [Comamonadaceae bacterium]|nr:hypothetical protein [Comamonadaceae bacterium]